MKKITLLLLVIFISNLAFSFEKINTSLKDEMKNKDEIRVIIKLKDKVKKKRGINLKTYLKKNAEISQKNLLNKITTRNSKVKSHWIINAVSATLTKEQINEVSKRDDVESIFPNYQFNLIEPLVKKDSKRCDKDCDNCPAKDNCPKDRAENDAYNIDLMSVDKVWSEFSLDGTGVITGVIDTGIHKSVPYLSKMIQGKDFTDSPTDFYDTQGHGSHVAGTVLGGKVSGDLYARTWFSFQKVGTFDGRIGVAPGAKFYCAKVFPDRNRNEKRTAGFDIIIDAIEYMASNSVRVANLSLGIARQVPQLREPVTNASKLGTFLVFAAGNSGRILGSPADIPGIFSVGAVDKKDAKASFSSIGPATWDGQKFQKPEVSAPGVAVVSYYLDKLCKLDGTSMAAPNTTGVIALMLQANPKLTDNQIWDIMLSTGKDLGTEGADYSFGYGRVDAYKAVKKAIEVADAKVVINSYLTNIKIIENRMNKRVEDLSDESILPYINRIRFLSTGLKNVVKMKRAMKEYRTLVNDKFEKDGFTYKLLMK